MRLLPLACALLLASCATDPKHIPGPSSKVTRKDAIAIAKVYQELQWTPSPRNIMHGKDAKGVLVHTPDEGLIKHGHKNGWWKPGEVMTGMPYQWGGFDTPRQFLKDLKAGHAAGDIATNEKRRLDDAGTSTQACGIDCSGFISRCWRLRRQYSTDELHLISDPLASIDDLKPGDILLANGHVMMYSHPDPMRLRHLIIIESTPNPTWRVNLGSIPIDRLERDGYRPWRYRKIVD